MGYRVKKQQYKLVFADEDMRGLEIVVEKLPLGLTLRMRELNAAAPEIANSPAAIRELCEGLIGSMVSWNLEDRNGHPVPLTVDGLLAQDEDFIQKVTSAWTLALGGVSAPLDDGSTSGGTFPEESISMEPLSPSQSNSFMPVSS